MEADPSGPSSQALAKNKDPTSAASSDEKNKNSNENEAGAGSGEPIISSVTGSFYYQEVEGKHHALVDIVLTPNQITFSNTKNSKSQAVFVKTFSTKDILGVHRQDGKIIIHFYIKSNGGLFNKPKGERVHNKICLVLNEKMKDELFTVAQKLEIKLRLILQNEDPNQDLLLRPKQLLVLINPASGSGAAVKRFNDLSIMFDQSNCKYTVLKTTHAGHAHEVARTLNLNEVDSIVCVSGDGLINEALNGLMSRDDWAEAINKISLGTLGGGSGNGLGKTITAVSGELFTPTNLAFITLKGQTRPLDLLSTSQLGQKPLFGFLSIAWAMVSDIDLESEEYRSCGGFRFTFTAIIRLFSVRGYDALLEYLPADLPMIEPTEKQKKKGKMPLPKVQTCTNYDKCQACTCLHNEKDLLTEFMNTQKNLLSKSDDSSNASNDNKNELSLDASISSGTEGDGWVRLNSNFNLIWSMNVPYAASDMYPAPLSHISDGNLDLIFITKGNTSTLLPLFLKLEDGEHLDEASLKYVKVKAFRLIPKAARRSEIAIDGERMPYGAITVNVWRGVAKLLSF